MTYMHTHIHVYTYMCKCRQRDRETDRQTDRRTPVQHQQWRSRSTKFALFPRNCVSTFAPGWEREDVRERRERKEEGAEDTVYM